MKDSKALSEACDPYCKALPGMGPLIQFTSQAQSFAQDARLCTKIAESYIIEV